MSDRDHCGKACDDYLHVFAFCTLKHINRNIVNIYFYNSFVYLCCSATKDILIGR